MRLLKVLLGLELLLGALWTLALIRTENIGMEGLMLLSWLYPPQLLFMGISVGYAVRHAETRRIAALVFALPLASLCLPGLLRVAFGAPLLADPRHVGFLFGGPVALALGFCVLLPHRAARYLPRSLLASRWLNVGLLLLAAGGLAGWVMLWVAYASVFEKDESGIALGLGIFCSFLLGIASLPIALYSYVGLFQSHDERQQRLRTGQLVLSSLLVLVSFGMLTLISAGMTAQG